MIDAKTAAMLARIDANVVHLKDLVEHHLEDDDRVHGDLETRLRSQEKFKYGVMACAALVITSGGFFGIMM